MEPWNAARNADASTKGIGRIRGVRPDPAVCPSCRRGGSMPPPARRRFAPATEHSNELDHGILPVNGQTARAAR
jgi:hypothetical protein